MSEKSQIAKEEQEELNLQETYNDDHWAKKYGVSAAELKSTIAVGLPARILQIISQNCYVPV